MIERQLGEVEVGFGLAGLRAGRVQQCCPSAGAIQRRCRIEIGQQYGVFERWQRRAQRLDQLQAIKVAPTITVAIDGDQHLGVDLPEAVQHTGRAHVRRTA